jgi:uncharacterized oligopeptide transporter (OPT) family protein
MLFGTGMLLGVHTALSMLAGAIVAWGGLAFGLARAHVIDRMDFVGVEGWLLWPGVALMTSSTLVAMLLDWRRFARGLAAFRSLRSEGSRGLRAGGSRGWSLGALAAVGVVVVVILSAAFGVHPLIAIAGLVLSILLAVVCARATGETDVAPVTQVGQLSQITLGTLTAGQVPPNVIGAQVVAGTATHTAAALWAFKTGHLLRAQARHQIFAAVLGAVTGVCVAVPAYFLLARTHGIANAMLPAPAALSWKALAEIVQRGQSALPRHAASAAWWLGVCGATLAVLHRTRLSRLLPSAIAAGMGFLMPPSYTVTIALGALGGALVRRTRPSWAEEHSLSSATGLITGEAVAGVAIAVLVALGIVRVSG